MPGPLKVIKNRAKVTLLDPPGYQNGLEAVENIDQRLGTGKREPKRLPKGMVLVKGTLDYEAPRAR